MLRLDLTPALSSEERENGGQVSGIWLSLDRLNEFPPKKEAGDGCSFSQGEKVRMRASPFAKKLDAPLRRCVPILHLPSTGDTILQ